MKQLFDVYSCDSHKIENGILEMVNPEVIGQTLSYTGWKKLAEEFSSVGKEIICPNLVLTPFECIIFRKK